MIKNQRQLQVSRRRAQELRDTLAELTAKPVDPAQHIHLRDLERRALQALLRDIEDEIADYTALVENPPRAITVDSLHNLPRALIQARIAAGLTHRSLAQRLGLKEQAIQRYESTDYRSANIARLAEVVDALGVRVTQELHLPEGHRDP